MPAPPNMLALLHDATWNQNQESHGDNVFIFSCFRLIRPIVNPTRQQIFDVLVSNHVIAPARQAKHPTTTALPIVLKKISMKTIGNVISD